MNEEEQIRMLYDTKQNVSVLGKDVEFIKRDLNEFKQDIKRDISEFKKDSKEQNAEINAKLEKLINEPREDMKMWKGKIASLIISGVAVLLVLGMGVWVTKITTETKQITQQYEQTMQK